jgi:hypothetical protein
MSLSEKHEKTMKLSDSSIFSYSGCEYESSGMTSSLSFLTGRLTGDRKPMSTMMSKELGVVETEAVSGGFAERDDSKSESKENYWALVAVSIMMVFCIGIFVTLMVVEVGVATRNEGSSEWEI